MLVEHYGRPCWGHFGTFDKNTPQITPRLTPKKVSSKNMLSKKGGFEKHAFKVHASQSCFQNIVLGQQEVYFIIPRLHTASHHLHFQERPLIIYRSWSIFLSLHRNRVESSTRCKMCNKNIHFPQVGRNSCNKSCCHVSWCIIQIQRQWRYCK